MKILLFATLVALAAADVSHLLNNQGSSGYQYQPPQTSYGVPQSSVLGNLEGSGSVQGLSYSSLGSVGAPELSLPSVSGPSLQFNSGFSSGSPISAGASSISGATIQTYENGGFSTPVPLTKESLARFQISTPAPSVDFSNLQVSTPSSAPSVNFVKYEQPANSYQFLSRLSQPSVSTIGINSAQFASDAALNSGFRGDDVYNLGLGGSQFVSKSSGSAGSLSDAFGVAAGGTIDVSEQAQLEPEVSKHLYFFDAPEDQEDEAETKISLPPVAPKKTYKIIFIKAPAYRSQGTITIPAPPATEEKTLVYVLVKKPEKNASVRFQAAAPTKPSKPEVFFIKYKTQKEAEEAVAEIQSKHGASGQVIANLPAGKSIDNIQIPSDIGVSSNPSVSFGGTAFGSTGFEGASIDSLGAKSYVLSSPSTIGFEARSGAGDSASAQSEITGQRNLQFGQFGSSGFQGASIDSVGDKGYTLSSPSTTSFEARSGTSDNAPAQSEITGQTNLQFGQFGSSGFQGASIDSVGAKSYVLSSPSTTSFSARSGTGDSAPAQSEITGQTNLQFGQFESGSFPGASIDSVGAKTYVLSSPSTIGFSARSGTDDSAPAQSDTAQFGQVGVSGTKTVSIGQQSTFQSFGGASGQSQSASSSLGSESDIESKSNVDSSESNQDSDDEDEEKEVSSSSQREESEKSDDSDNKIESRINSDAADSEGQGSNQAGFKTYGVPSPGFKTYGPPNA